MLALRWMDVDMKYRRPYRRETKNGALCILPAGNGGSQREVYSDHSPAAPSSATNNATVMLNGQRAALGISPRSIRRSVFQCEMPANTVATTPPRTKHSPKRIAP
jgi:hypothetical protein